MKTLGLVKCGSTIVALAILSACNAGSAVAPATNGFDGIYNGRPVTAARTPIAAPRFETIVPDHHEKKDYEYIINDYGSYASIFDYPKSTKEIGKVRNVGGQGCTNVSYGYGKGIIWIVAGSDQIEEIKVPKKPIKTLDVGSAFPTSCAMDASGDLAVGIYEGTTYAGGDLVIFKNGAGTPKAYSTALDEEFFDGYDNKGNLFADGFTGYRAGFALVELPKGSSKFVTLKTSNAPQFPGSVQWDGTYLTVFDQLANELYQYSVSGTMATLKNTVQLSGSSDCAQTWIATGVLYCADAGNDQGEVFNYPAGGSPVAVLSGTFDFPLGVTAAKR